MGGKSTAVRAENRGDGLDWIMPLLRTATHGTKKGNGAPKARLVGRAPT